jgi:hypothetical protein
MSAVATAAATTARPIRFVTEPRIDPGREAWIRSSSAGLPRGFFVWRGRARRSALPGRHTAEREYALLSPRLILRACPRARPEGARRSRASQTMDYCGTVAATSFETAAPRPPQDEAEGDCACFSPPSCPHALRASTTCFAARKKDVDARHKRGHDVVRPWPPRPPISGLPETGFYNAQAGQGRLVARRTPSLCEHRPVYARLRALGARSLASSPRAGSQDEAGREQRVLPLGRVPPRQRTPPRTTSPNEKAPRETRRA